METVGNAALGRQSNHGVHHVTASGHAEPYVTGTLKNQCSGLDEILRTLLHRDSAQECNHLLMRFLLGNYIPDLLRKRLNGVVHGRYLARILMVLVDDSLTGQFAHAHDVVGVVHTVLLDCIYGGVHVTAAAVKISCVDVYDQRLAAHLLGVYACGISKPVMRVNYIKLLGAGHYACHYRVVVYLLVKVVRISARELYATQIIGVHIAEIGIDMVTEMIIIIRVHPRVTLLEHTSVGITPNHRNGVHSHNLHEALVLITPWLGQAERNVHVPLIG